MTENGKLTNQSNEKIPSEMKVASPHKLLILLKTLLKIDVYTVYTFYTVHTIYEHNIPF